MGERIPELVVLDKMDWTVADVLRHLEEDVEQFNRHLTEVLAMKSRDRELDSIQNFVGRCRTWLLIYAAVTNQPVSNVNFPGGM